MTFNRGEFHSFEGIGVTSEKIVGNGVTVATHKFTGDRGLKLDYTLAGEAQVVSEGQVNMSATAEIIVVSFACSVSASPAAVAPVWADLDFGEGGGDKYYIAIETDRTIGIYDKNHVRLGKSTGTVNASAVMKDIVVGFDGKTLSTVWVWIYIEGTEDTAFDTGLTWGDMFATGANTITYFGKKTVGSVPNMQLYLDNTVEERSTDGTDALDQTQYPRLKARGSMWMPPDPGNGTYTDWTPLGAPNHGDEIDETGAHDGDSSYNKATATDQRDSYKPLLIHTNPIPSGSTVRTAQLRAVGRKTSSKHSGGEMFVRTGPGSTPADTDGASDGGHFGATTYKGYVFLDIPKPGGGSWVWQDGNSGVNSIRTEFGVHSAASGTISTRVTKIGSIDWLWYNTLLPLGTTPSVPSVGQPTMRRWGGSIQPTGAQRVGKGW